MSSVVDVRRSHDVVRASVWAVAAAAVVALALLAGGCAAPVKKNAEKDRRIQTLWPEPPDQPRFAYQTILRSLADIRIENEKERLQRVMTGSGVNDESVYDKPTGVAARRGRIYVADPLRHSVVVFDVPRGKVFRFGVREPNNLVQPNSVAIDGQDRVYVLDTRLKKVLVYDSLGLFEFSVGSKDDFVHPVGLAVSQDGQRIYVVDRGSLNADDHKVVVFAPDGARIQTLGPRGKGEGQFNIPLEAAVTPEGNLAVLDSGNFRVQIFDPHGRFLRAFGSLGNASGQLSRPRGIAVDKDGNFYVSDAAFNNVQVFNPSGELLLAIGGLDLEPGPGRFALIGALAADEAGYVYVADSFHKKIEVYRRLSDEQGRALMQTK